MKKLNITPIFLDNMKKLNTSKVSLMTWNIHSCFHYDQILLTSDIQSFRFYKLNERRGHNSRLTCDNAGLVPLFILCCTEVAELLVE